MQNQLKALNMISALHLRSYRAPGLCVQILYSVLILWTKEMDGLSDFSNYLFRIIKSQSAQACDGDLLLLRCPRHSTITIQSAFYGQRTCITLPKCSRKENVLTHSLYKVLSECQGHRNCQFLVNHQVFGRDPCPGTPKYLHVSYKCKPTEHKKRISCEGDRLLLHCKYPKVLNIYSAVYGRQLEEEDLCPSEKQEPPPFVPQSLLKEADPSINPKPTLSIRTFTFCVNYSSHVLTSSFLFLSDHPEMAGLLFTSSVCVGLLIVLIAVSTKLTCSRHLNATRTFSKKSRTTNLEEEDPMNQDDDEEEDDEDEKGSLMDSSNLSEIGRRVYCWEDVTYTTEAAELMERIERRELVMQEIRMNAYLNGNKGFLHSYMPTITQNVQ
uniref:Eva-1 homolog C (C. elegans) n=1 Tax=Cyprinus carpio TaxID=7962 RepID=A0A8C1G5R6_CYPCA